MYIIKFEEINRFYIDGGYSTSQTEAKRMPINEANELFKSLKLSGHKVKMFKVEVEQ